MNRTILTLLCFCLIGFSFLFAQVPGDIAARTDLDPRLWPFYHGVASGDPLPNQVIIWTRVSPWNTALPVSVDWAMATDTAISNVVQSGTVTTDDSHDFTVKVDVMGLQPNTWYYYRFTMDGRKSLTGRTRTAPVGEVDSLRFAVVSCSDYVDGYFHGYQKIVERNDIDAVLHLGDYIYENGSEGSIGRPHDPPNRTVALDDYRQRYSQYRLDGDLRCIHQMYPFINVWDDHEIANNAWKNGAEAHDLPDDGLYAHRKRMAVQAFYEWIPIRNPDPADSTRIYRSFEWGNLLDLIMIDTRHVARDSQVTGGLIDDPTRYMLGPDQLNWLSQEMQTSPAQWKIIGQQVMMAPLEIPFVGPLATDSWDGYRAERDRFYDTILVKNIDNIVVLTGDIHSAWANNLESGNTPVGVEFIVSSITTMNSPFAVSQTIIQAANPHIKYANISDHGYTILTIDSSHAQADYYFVGDIEDPNDNSETAEAFWYVEDGDRFLQEANQAEVPRSTLNVLQPFKDPPNPVGIKEDLKPTVFSVIGSYPNPFWEDFAIKAYLFKPTELTLRLFDQQGRLVREIRENKLGKGINYIEFQGNDLPKGIYSLQIQAEEEMFSLKVVKI